MISRLLAQSRKYSISENEDVSWRWVFKYCEFHTCWRFPDFGLNPKWSSPLENESINLRFPDRGSIWKMFFVREFECQLKGWLPILWIPNCWRFPDCGLNLKKSSQSKNEAFNWRLVANVVNSTSFDDFQTFPGLNPKTSSLLDNEVWNCRVFPDFSFLYWLRAQSKNMLSVSPLKL